METFNDPREVIQMQLKSWSYSRLEVGEKCLAQAKYKYIDKIPEPDRPLPPGKTEHANDRGTRLHGAAELFTKGGVELAPELLKFQDEHTRLRDLHENGSVSTEGEWAFTQNWESVAWMSWDAWCRVKCDTVVTMDYGNHVITVDYKSGKRFGNEMKHGEQMEMYAFTTALKNPAAKTITTELWYWDQNELKSETYTRDEALAFLPKYEKRGQWLTSQTEFPPNPNRFTCKWCPYRKEASGGNGHCPVAAL